MIGPRLKSGAFKSRYYYGGWNSAAAQKAAKWISDQAEYWTGEEKVPSGTYKRQEIQRIKESNKYWIDKAKNLPKYIPQVIAGAKLASNLAAGNYWGAAYNLQYLTRGYRNKRSRPFKPRYRKYRGFRKKKYNLKKDLRWYKKNRTRISRKYSKRLPYWTWKKRERARKARRWHGSHNSYTKKSNPYRGKPYRTKTAPIGSEGIYLKKNSWLRPFISKKTFPTAPYRNY